jgi:hypothetical protein
MTVMMMMIMMMMMMMIIIMMMMMMISEKNVMPKDFISIFGRINIDKMTVVFKLIYISRFCK